MILHTGSDMDEMEVKTRLNETEEKLRLRYSKLSKIFLILGFLLVLWAIIVFISARVLNYGYDWALLSVQNWVLLVSIIIVIFIVLIVIFFIHFYTLGKKLSLVKKPKVEYVAGKKVHIFTFPQGSEGGIFSKTYVEIDDENILRVRTLMLSPEKLWGKKEK